MSNMYYCMFENTYRELGKCLEEMCITEPCEQSESERKYREKLILLCGEIIHYFGD